MAGAGSAQTPADHRCTSSARRRRTPASCPRARRAWATASASATGSSGDDTGFDRGVCTIVGKPQILCTIQVQLSKGTLTVQGMLPERANKTPVAVTGGTGAYNGARGTALVTDHGNGQTDVEITLLP